eukprot:c15251_g1_i1 orf=74-280(+)
MAKKPKQITVFKQIQLSIVDKFTEAKTEHQSNTAIGVPAKSKKPRQSTGKQYCYVFYLYQAPSIIPCN